MHEYSIQKTIGQYCHLIDDGRIDDLSKLFAEDAVFDVSSFGIRKVGRPAIHDQFLQMVDPNVKGMHCTFNPVIHISGNEATASFDYIWVSFLGRPRIGLGGRYHLRFVSSSERWLIREMRVEVRSDPAFISGE
jgi:hypothetical protein